DIPRPTGRRFPSPLGPNRLRPWSMSDASAMSSYRQPTLSFGVPVSGDDHGAATPGPMSTFTLHRTDAIDLLRSLPPESVDLIVTDPAYESLEKHRAIGTTTRLKHSKSSSNDWFSIFPNDRFPELFAEAFRVMK